MKKMMMAAAALALVALAGCDCMSCTTVAEKPAPAPVVAQKPVDDCPTCPFARDIPAVITRNTAVPASIEGSYVPTVTEREASVSPAPVIPAAAPAPTTEQVTSDADLQPLASL